MATFTYAPDWGASPELEPGLRSVRFGDGYEQRATNGLNPILPTWNLQFTKRTQAEAQAIYSWMIANNAQVTAFDWAAPGEGTAAGELFGTGDGTRVTYSLQALSRPCTVVGTPTIYRTDWQGTYQLFSTPRTNIAPYSQDLSGASWVKVNLTEALVTAPDGTSTGKQVTATATAGTTFIHTGGVATSTTMAFSIFAKTGGTRATVPFIPRNNTTATNFQTGTFDTVTGAITGAGWTSTPVPGAPGWFRLAFVQTTGITIGNSVRMYCGANGGSLNAGDSWITWGVQIEANAVTPYIPTTTAAVTVTDYSISGPLVTLAANLATGSTLTWTGAYTRKHVAKFGVPKPDAHNSWSITADFREVPA